MYFDLKYMHDERQSFVDILMKENCEFQECDSIEISPIKYRLEGPKI